MIRRPPRSTQSRSSAASDVYKRQEDGAAFGAVDVAAGVVGAQAGEAAGVDDAAGGGGQGEQVGAVRGGHRPDVAQFRVGQLLEVVVRVLSGVEDDRHIRCRL